MGCPSILRMKLHEGRSMEAVRERSREPGNE